MHNEKPAFGLFQDFHGAAIWFLHNITANLQHNGWVSIVAPLAVQRLRRLDSEPRLSIRPADLPIHKFCFQDLPRKFRSEFASTLRRDLCNRTIRSVNQPTMYEFYRLRIYLVLPTTIKLTAHALNMDPDVTTTPIKKVSSDLGMVLLPVQQYVESIHTMRHKCCHGSIRHLQFGAHYGGNHLWVQFVGPMAIEGRHGWQSNPHSSIIPDDLIMSPFADKFLALVDNRDTIAGYVFQ
mmetsp:Transcript_78654/g.155807  ORF Transcript_78654/g.155807 Transcript_78654/m.155807 type:complete len:237 (-) Transcript_78654:221-931(-)